VQTHLQQLEQAFRALGQLTYAARLGVGRDEKHARHKALRWNMVGSAGYVYCTGNQQQACFDQRGDLVQPLTLYFQGDVQIILQELSKVGLHASTTPEMTLIVSPEERSQKHGR
jgi:Protein of unknown function (DUF2913)